LVTLEQSLTPAERDLVASLRTPQAIQAFLDAIPYSIDPFYRCPLAVLRDGRAHCFDGALFAAAMLRRLGDPPLIVEMLPNERDDDHLVAPFKRGRFWGAVAKSNFSGLRYREPVYRSLRELIMSYFESFFNAAGEKTLRGYTLPLDLSRLDGLGWETCSEALDAVAEQLDRARRVRILSPEQIAGLSPVDYRSLKAGLLGSDEAGLYKVQGGLATDS